MSVSESKRLILKEYIVSISHVIIKGKMEASQHVKIIDNTNVFYILDECIFNGPEHSSSVLKEGNKFYSTCSDYEEIGAQVNTWAVNYRVKIMLEN